MAHNADNPPSSSATQGYARIKGVLIIVALVALVINVLALSASQLWVAPDTYSYVTLGGGIADHLDFRQHLFLIRPPGYPLFLAAIFRLFGPRSPTAILVAQHAMVVGVAVVTALIAWHLTNRRSVTLLAGLMCACSLQLLAFANVILSEVPCTFALVLSVYFLTKYHRLGRGRFLAMASLMAGVSYLFRPISMLAVAVCVAAALHQTWKLRETGLRGHRTSTSQASRRRSRRLGSPFWWHRAVAGLTLAVVPAMAVALPGMIQNMRVHGARLSGFCTNVVLYGRAVGWDGLDSTTSEALADIRAVLKEAIDRGCLPPDADYRERAVVIKAYRGVRNIPPAESGAIMGRAGRDIIRENLWRQLELTARYVAWMTLVPDAFYRFHPGGAPGKIDPANAAFRIRDKDAEIFDVATYEPMLRRWLQPYWHYLPLRSNPGVTTPLWSGIARWYYRHIDKGPPLVGVGDSPYEEFRFFCLVGVVVSLLTRERTTWLLMTGVVFLHIFGSAFFGGHHPRYAVPSGPLLLIYAALLIVMTVRLLAAAVRRCGILRLKSPCRPASSQIRAVRS